MVDHLAHSGIQRPDDDSAQECISAPAPTPTAAPSRHDSISAWIARALDGIQQMHQNESVRRRVARRLF